MKLNPGERSRVDSEEAKLIAGVAELLGEPEDVQRVVDRRGRNHEPGARLESDDGSHSGADPVVYSVGHQSWLGRSIGKMINIRPLS